MGLRPELRVTFGHEEISDFPTLVNKCRIYEDNEERKPYSPPTSSRGNTSHGMRTHGNAGGSRLNSPSLCGKCGRIHVGDSCPSTTLSCFSCKEVGHVRRYCPKFPQSMNAVRAERPRSTGRVFTMSGAEASGVDGLIKGKLHGDRYSLFSVVEFGSDTLPDICVKCEKLAEIAN
ncbi:hypothetical protein Lal_00019140 [Lupinus albus]|nr:hypothetical protein Lal_00019140 [Lupinus albus]